MAAAAAVMAEQPPLESRVARLESDVAHIRADIGDIKLEIRDLRIGLVGLRDDVRQELGKLREEMILGDGSRRAQIQKLEASMDLKLSKLDHDLTRGVTSTRIWMLLQIAAVLGVMAHSLGWL